MKLKTVELTREIRDSIYNKIKDLSREEQVEFYRNRAKMVHKKIENKKIVKT